MFDLECPGAVGAQGTVRVLRLKAHGSRGVVVPGGDIAVISAAEDKAIGEIAGYVAL